LVKWNSMALPKPCWDVRTGYNTKERTMRRVLTGLAALILMLAGISYAAAVTSRGEDELTVTVRNNLAEFSFDKVGGYDYVRGPGVVYLPDAGVPGLPLKPYHIAIPWDRRVTEIEAVCRSELAIDGTFHMVPTQPPAVLGESAAAWMTGRPDIYLEDGVYPKELVGGMHQGFMGDTRLLSFYVSPFIWNPVTGELTFCEEIQVRVELEPSVVSRPARHGQGGHDRFRETVARMVANPDDIGLFKASMGVHALLGAPVLEEGNYEYVVVTVDSLAPSFEPLVQWKNEKGVPATCVTWEWIDANYAGDNTQTKIRDFIIDAYQTWGTVWVLLGGDTGLIPSRQVYAMDAKMGLLGNKIRADLYYSDLDGTWNANGVTPYGEVADSVDMYPDVFVGRAPANSTSDAVAFVNKVLRYEKNPPADYALRMLMTGEILWSNPFTDSGVGLDRIDRDFIPSRFDPIVKLYETLGNESRESVLAAMSQGRNFVLHDGHCNENVMGAGDGTIWYTDADTLSNWPKNFILNSIGCWPAAIDRDCIAEHFVNNPDGGWVAFIGNCRYGWGSPGNPGFGYSDKFQYEWARSIFVNEVFELGASLAEHKAVFVGFAGDENVYRWNEYQVNLLGDPEMPVWTDDPADLYVTAPQAVMASGDQVTIVVEDDKGAVDGALVCLMNGGDVYEKGTTDLAGTVVFGVSTSSPDSLLLTVTAPNHRHRQSKLPVVTGGVLLSWTGLDILDGGDAKANPGEVTDIGITVKNFGSEPDSGVWGVVRATDLSCSVVDSIVYFGDIPAGGEVSGLNSPSLEFDGSLTNGQSVVLEFELADSSSTQWMSRIPIVIATPLFSVTSYGIDDEAGGDGDFVAEPGESMVLTVETYNSGLTYDAAQVTVTSLDPYVAVADSVTGMGSIDPGCAGYTVHLVTVDAGCPDTHVARLLATIEALTGFEFADTVYFTVGDLNFADDCEAGEGSWTYGGLWHLSSYRSHSDSMSWYFGNESVHEYPSGAYGNLISLDFIAGEDNRLSFWFWHDFTTYGVDGVYVVVMVNGRPDTLDFIGSGGALDGSGTAPLDIVTDWVKWDHALEGVAPDDTLTFKFGFASDNTDVAEGMYIDDIAFSCKAAGRSGMEVPVSVAGTIGITLVPNPARGEVNLSLSGMPAPLSIGIYNVDGRLVTRFDKPAGASSVTWNLRDSSGKRVAPGIYVARVEGRAGSQSSKIVVLR
jgi:hypothetical protein